jgi:CheY-like chemotaxis protein
MENSVVVGSNSPTPTVLVATSREEFAAAVSRHLTAIGASVHGHDPRAEIGIEGIRELLPDVAFVDLDAVTADKFPFYKALSNVVPDCQIILLCERERAGEAARLARVWEVFDYLLTDCELDPHRLQLSIERAQLDSIPKLSEIRGFAKRQNRRILELLSEMKNILKADCTSPVVKAIREFKYDSAGAHSGEAFAAAGLAAEYRSHLLDIICGKLRRLESEIYSLGGGQPPEPCAAADSVLLVEDDAVSAELARGLLERNGFDVILAKTDDEAIHELSRQRPSLVLMDVHLGISDGLHIVKMMRSRADLQDIPVIVITADRHRETLFDAVEARVQGYLLKPYQPREFIEKVKNAIYRAPQSRSA